MPVLLAKASADPEAMLASSMALPAEDDATSATALTQHRLSEIAVAV